MVFNSYSFLVFFVINLLLYYLPVSWTVKKINLLLASYCFYAAWSPPFVLLLMTSSVVDYQLAKWLHAAESPSLRKFWLICSLLLNLGLLILFKYGAFLVQNWNAATGYIFDFEPLPVPELILPLGISFYTFETVSYLIDVYRRKIEPSRSFLDYALFLTFFPHLVAGPIVRAGDFLPQCVEERKPSLKFFGWGLFLMLLGMGEKVILADRLLAPAADRVYSTSAPVSIGDAWIGTMAFAGQIFFDFAGYSTCGIGAALCLGFQLTRNFYFPYAALGFSDFWRRWHVSLSTWLRDYLYIPLGGNRGSQWSVSCNLMTTMLLGGLWHGASWQFVVWGGLHGLFLLVERQLRRVFGGLAVLQTFPAQLGIGAITFVLVLFTWIYFRAVDMASANRIASAMLGFTRETASILDPIHLVGTLGVLGGLVAAHWVLRNTTLEEFAARRPWFVVTAAGAGLAIALILIPGDNRAFIYFQF